MACELEATTAAGERRPPPRLPPAWHRRSSGSRMAVKLATRSSALTNGAAIRAFPATGQLIAAQLDQLSITGAWPRVAASRAAQPGDWCDRIDLMQAGQSRPGTARSGPAVAVELRSAQLVTLQARLLQLFGKAWRWSWHWLSALGPLASGLMAVAYDQQGNRPCRKDMPASIIVIQLLSISIGESPSNPETPTACSPGRSNCSSRHERRHAAVLRVPCQPRSGCHCATACRQRRPSRASNVSGD